MTDYTCVLWDVDGTLLDGSEDILLRISAILRAHGIDGPTAADARHWLGPALETAFRDWAGLSQHDAADAVIAFDEGLRADGPEAATTYPGILDLIRDLNDAGIAQATASAKDERQLRALLARDGLDRRFTAICGARSLPGRPDTKAEIVARALAELESADVDTSRPVLIGDRRHDVEAGAFHGIPVVFVDWGYGDASESEGSVLHAHDSAELRAFLLGGTAQSALQPSAAHRLS